MRLRVSHGPYSRTNVYGEGGAGKRIVNLLATHPFASDILNKVNTY